MLWLALAACTTPEAPPPVGGDSVEALPPGWWWVSAQPGFEAAFPDVPAVSDTPEVLDLGQGAVSLPARRVQVVTGTSSFTVSVVDLPDGDVPPVASLMDARAAALSAELADRAPWSPPGLSVGEQARLQTNRPGESLLRMTLDGHDLWIVQGVGDRAGSAARFVGSFSRVEVAPRSVPIGGGSVACPARCGEREDRVKLAGGLEPLATLRGVVGEDTFEVAALRVPAGVDVGAALEVLEQRAVRRSRGNVTSDTMDGEGRTLEITAGRGRTRLLLTSSTSHAYALEVFAPSGALPEWAPALSASLVP